MVNDPDAGDTWIYKIVSGDNFGRFDIDGNSGILQFMTDYVVDKPDLMPPSVTLVIAAVDSAGASGTIKKIVLGFLGNHKSILYQVDKYVS